MRLETSGTDQRSKKLPWAELIREKAALAGLMLSPQQTDQFSFYAQELMKWSRKINLTAIDEPEAIIVKHFLDSLAAANQLAGDEHLLDIGTGAGFPGIPLKIVHPSLSVTAIDGSRKKISFVSHLIRALSLANITAVQIRSEQLRTDAQHRNAYDVVASRALSDLDRFVQQAFDFVKRDGRILTWKSARVDKEIRNFRKAVEVSEKMDREWFEIRKIPYALPGFEEKRCLVAIKIHR